MLFPNENFNIRLLWGCSYVIEFYFTQEVICKELKIHKTEKAFSLHELQTLQIYYHSNVLLKGIQDWNSIAQFLIDRATTTATQPLC